MIQHFSKQGNVHVRHAAGNQDVLQGWFDRDYAVIVAADGVSAARHGAEGADIACRTAMEMLKKYRDSIFDFDRRKLAYLMLEQILYEIEQRCGSEDVCQYASTLMFACLRRRDGMLLLWNLGDGGVLRTGSSGAVFELSPRRYGGVPCQTTTQDAYRAVEIRKVQLKYGESVLLMTDGLLADTARHPALLQSACRGDFDEMKRISQALEYSDDASWIAMMHRE